MSGVGIVSNTTMNGLARNCHASVPIVAGIRSRASPGPRLTIVDGTPMAWMFVIGEAQALDWVLAEERMAFRAHVKTSELAVGDRVAIYASRGTWHNPTVDRAQLAAIGSITSAVSEKQTTVGLETMPASCELSFSMKLPARNGVEFAPLVPRLSFITKKASWGAALRRTIVRLSEKDLGVLEKALAAEIKRRS